MTTGSEILTRQREYTRYIQWSLSATRSRALEDMLFMRSKLWVEPKLKIALNTGNIFRDAFPFLFPFRYEYPELPKGGDKIKIRMPIKFNCIGPIVHENTDSVLSIDGRNNLIA